MTWILLAFQILGALPKLMLVAEQAFDGIEDSSEDKKQMVLTAAQAIVGGVLGISSGGQAETWARIEKIVAPAIDIFCTFLFPHEDKTT